MVAVGEGVPATVELAEHLGDSSVLYLRVDGMSELLCAKVAGDVQSLATGASVGVMPDAERTLGFDAEGVGIS